MEALWSQFEGVMASKEDGNQEDIEERKGDEEKGGDDTITQ